MNVATVKTGKRGRPAFRRVNGVIFSTPSGGWDFLPADPDLFGGDSIHLAVPRSFPSRAKCRILSILNDGRDAEVTLAFSGQSITFNDGRTFFDCRFVGFPSWVK